MLKEAIEAIQSLAVDAAEATADAKEFTVRNLPRKVWIQRGKSFEAHDIEPPFRQHRPRDLATIGALAIDSRVSPKPVLWHSDKSVALVMDDESRRDVAVLDLSHDPRFALIESMAGRAFTQKEIVRALRVELHGTHDSTLLLAVKQVKFASSADGESTVEHGKQSMGKSVTAQVTGASAIPDEVSFTTAVYSEFPDWQATIRCAVDIDVDEQKFRVLPLAGELKTAIDDAQAKIADALEEIVGTGVDGKACVPISYGQN